MSSEEQQPHRRDDSSALRDRGNEPVGSNLSESERCQSCSDISKSAVPLIVLSSIASPHHHKYTIDDVALIDSDGPLSTKKNSDSGKGVEIDKDESEADTLSTLSVNGQLLEPNCEIFWPEDDFDDGCLSERSNQGGSLQYSSTQGGSLQYSSSQHSEGKWVWERNNSFKEALRERAISYVSDISMDQEDKEIPRVRTISYVSEVSVEQDDGYLTQGFIEVGELPRIY